MKFYIVKMMIYYYLLPLKHIKVLKSVATFATFYSEVIIWNLYLIKNQYIIHLLIIFDFSKLYAYKFAHIESSLFLH